jgi:quinol monooxygenase YgiN
MSKKIITLAAQVEAKPEFIEYIKSAGIELAKMTQQEPGCIQYNFHQDNDNPAIFLFFEYWNGQEGLDAHMATEHLQSFLKDVEDKIVELKVNNMSKLA